VTWQIMVSKVITRGVKSALIEGSIQDAAPMMCRLLHKSPSRVLMPLITKRTTSTILEVI